MSIEDRKERERAGRHDLILSSARELAETQGWDAVTIRRLAERIEYSQPVIYTHFRGKQEIIAGVALEGFTELTELMRRTADRRDAPREVVSALAAAYVTYATDHPAAYAAMFQLSTGLPFADRATPTPLRDSFDELRRAIEATNPSTDPDLLAETLWAGLHGLVNLTRAGRLPPQRADARIRLLVDSLVAEARPAPAAAGTSAPTSVDSPGVP